MHRIWALRENKRVRDVVVCVGGVLFYAIAAFSTEALLGQRTGMRPGPTAVLLLVLLFVSAALFGLTGRVFLSGFLPTLAALAFYLIHFYRTLITGSVLIPADLALAGHLRSILTFTSIPPKPRPIAAVVLMVLGWILLWFLSGPVSRRMASCRKKRPLIFLTGLLFALAVFFVSFASRDAGDPSALSYQKYGAGMGFLHLLVAGPSGAAPPVLPAPIAAPPAEEGDGGDYIQSLTLGEYGRETMEAVIAAIRAGAADAAASPSEKPDLVVVMSEAFFDVTRIETLRFTEDPLQNFHRLAARPATITGNVIAPTFGGQTCNTEYEFLTGHLMLNIAEGEIPYLQYERYFAENEAKSIAALLTGQGYRAVGLHTYTGRFYDRTSIYQRLGFDAFFSAEDMPDADRSGGFISDDYFAEALIAQLEQAEEPLFLFGISMENHYEYENWKYGGDTDIWAESDVIDGALLEGATVLAQGLKNADKALGKLIEYLEERERPTLLFYFGDHLPLVGSNALDFYRALGYVEAEEFYAMTAEETYKMYTTPYLIWANYALKETDYSDMSPAFIGSALIDLAGLRDSVYTQFMRDAYRHFHGAIRNLFVDGQGRMFREPTADIFAALRIQQLLQHDYVNGRGYVSEAQTALLNLAEETARDPGRAEP